MLNIIEHSDPQQWQSVEDMIIQEARDEAEKKLQKWSKIVQDISGITPEILIKEGITSEKILEFLEEDDQIRYSSFSSRRGRGNLVL